MKHHRQQQKIVNFVLFGANARSSWAIQYSCPTSFVPAVLTSIIIIAPPVEESASLGDRDTLYFPFPLTEMENQKTTSADITGPWELKKDPYGSGEHWIYDEDGVFLASVGCLKKDGSEQHDPEEIDPERTEKVARLLVTAPKLLEACEWMMHELCDAWDESPEKAIPLEYREAIREAHGNTP